PVLPSRDFSASTSTAFPYTTLFRSPIEQEGTYPLPEAQLDRFMFNIPLDYPSFAEEVDVVKQTTGAGDVQLSHVLKKEDILYFQDRKSTRLNSSHVSTSYAVSCLKQ